MLTGAKNWLKITLSLRIQLRLCKLEADAVEIVINN